MPPNNFQKKCFFAISSSKDEHVAGELRPGFLETYADDFNLDADYCVNVYCESQKEIVLKDRILPLLKYDKNFIDDWGRTMNIYISFVGVSC